MVQFAKKLIKNSCKMLKMKFGKFFKISNWAIIKVADVNFRIIILSSFDIFNWLLDIYEMRKKILTFMFYAIRRN